jgi:N-glycosylase/DNA lyase
MIIKVLKREYKTKRAEIKKRLKDFSKTKNKEDIFYELCFCLLTPQSNAFKCDDAIKELKKIDFYNKNINKNKIKKILNDKTRFYKNKSNYLINSKSQIEIINKKINQLKINKKNNNEIRDYLIKNVKGLGLKEASHFLRNIGYRNFAILDRHILKNLFKLKVISEIPKSLNKNQYLEIEKKFYDFSKKININMDELDLLFWSIGTGKVFK